jgi:hypothetical protein
VVAVTFKPSKTKSSFNLVGDVDIAARACLDCGAVDLSLDPAALIDLTGEPGAGGAAAT